MTSTSTQILGCLILAAGYMPFFFYFFFLCVCFFSALKTSKPVVTSTKSDFQTCGHIHQNQDPKFMPKEKSCWSAWNGLNLPGAPAVVTYWINKLQPGACMEGDVFVTLNPPKDGVCVMCHKVVRINSDS